MKKYIISIFILIMTGMSFTACASVKSLSVDYLTLSLERAKSKEERKKILEINKNQITSDFVISLIEKAGTCSGSEKEKLSDIAIETAEFTGDRRLIARILYIREIFKADNRKNYSCENLEKAGELFHRAGDIKGEVSCYYLQAWSLSYSISNREKSFSLIKKGENLLPQINDELFKGHYYYHSGEVYFTFFDKEKYLQSMSEAVSIYEKKGDLLMVLFCYEHMGNFCTGYGFFEEGKKYYEMLRILTETCPEKIKTFPPEERGYIDRTSGYYSKEYSKKERWTGRYYLNLGLLYKDMGKYEESIKSYREIINFKGTMDKLFRINACISIAEIYLLLGQKDITMKYLEEALRLQPEGYKICNLYERMGYIYLYEFKKPDEAMKYFQEELKKTGELQERLKESYRLTAMEWIGKVYVEKGDFDRALKIFEEISKIDSKKNSSEIYALIGDTYIKKGDKNRALFFIKKAVKIVEGKTDRKILPLYYKKTGDYYSEGDNLKEGLYFYEKALELAEGYELSSLWEYYFSLGKLYEKKGDSNKASKACSHAIELIENMRHDLKVEEIKRDFMKDKIKVYELMIDLLMKMKREKEAFVFSEKARSRAFLDMMGNQKIDIHRGINPSLLAKEEELEKQMTYLTAAIKEEKNKIPENRTDSFLMESEEKLKDLRIEYQKILEEIKIEHPEYATLVSVNPSSPEDIQSCLDKDTALVEYFLGENIFYIWIINNREFKNITVDCSRKDLEKLIKDYREYACDHMTGEKLKDNKWKDISHSLYKILFKDIEKYTSSRKRILIVPHRILYYIPFQILIDDRGTLLLENYEITYLPSAGIFKYCREKNTMKKEKLLAFEPGNMETGGYYPLPGAVKEVISISKYFPTKEIYTGKDMKTDILYKEGKKSDVLHFATHGFLESASPLFSSLLFSDRSLPVYEIFDLDLRAYLVTLSACKTGLGEEANGDEFVGLSRAFIYAGTPSICSSLWDVSDVTTSKLMDRFYYYLTDHNKSESLRLAQLDIMKEYPHPFFWAPFILTGDWR